MAMRAGTGVCHIPLAVQNMLCVLLHLILSGARDYHCPILQMRKLRLRNVRQLTQGHRTRKWQNVDPTQDFLSLKLSSCFLAQVPFTRVALSPFQISSPMDPPVIQSK